MHEPCDMGMLVDEVWCRVAVPGTRWGERLWWRYQQHVALTTLSNSLWVQAYEVGSCAGIGSMCSFSHSAMSMVAACSGSMHRGASCSCCRPANCPTLREPFCSHSYYIAHRLLHC
jgi:hypothetical protein